MSILTPQEAADMLKLGDPDDYPQLAIILPAADDSIKTATGRDWSSDSPIDPTAKIVATVLAARWLDNPGQIGEALKPTDPLVAMIGQLQAKALQMVTV